MFNGMEVLRVELEYPRGATPEMVARLAMELKHRLGCRTLAIRLSTVLLEVPTDPGPDALAIELSRLARLVDW